MTIHINGMFAFFASLFVSLSLIFAGAVMLPANYPSIHQEVGTGLAMFGFLGLGLVFGFGASEIFHEQ